MPGAEPARELVNLLIKEQSFGYDPDTARTSFTHDGRSVGYAIARGARSDPTSSAVSWGRSERMLKSALLEPLGRRRASGGRLRRQWHNYGQSVVDAHR